MNKILLFIFVCLLLSSCSKYYFFSMQHSSQQEAEGKYVVNNEMFSVAYDFEGLSLNGKKAFVATVENKGNDPLYVNWSKSAMIVEGKSYSYEVDEKISFIPPKAYVSKTCSVRVEVPYPHYPEDKFEKVTVQRSPYSITVRKYTFDEENSLFKFSNYLTLSLDALSIDEIKLSHDFWVSEVLE
ncbi:MAG: hypothetical protein AAF734_03280, partial [Bacteroidota bacterium]